MKTKLPLVLLLLISHLSSLTSQIPQGFNYQAIARGYDGKEIANTTLQVKISILSDTTGFYAGGNGTYVWEEQQSVKTNNLGLFTLTVGNPLAVKIQGSAASFSLIDWKQQPLYIGTKINYSGWKNMGTSRLWSVPYAMVAGDLKNNSRVQVSGNASSSDSILFEVKNRNGQTIFAVYEEGVRIYVDDGAYKGKGKGGFAIGSFGTAKAPSQEYFRVTRDSTRVYVNQLAKGTKGGFAIGGFDPAKGPVNNFMNLTPNNYFIGHQAGSGTTTGLYNNFIGFEAGTSNTAGGNNSFIGYQAGKANLTGNTNTFVGNQAGAVNQSGSSNTFVGTLAGTGFLTGANNTYLGVGAGLTFQNGNYNVFIGSLAGAGYQFPAGATGGTNNVAVGTAAGYKLNTGSNNVLLGNFAGAFNTAGSNNVFLGYQAGYTNSTGNYNLFLGNQSGFSNTTGLYNTFLGFQAGYTNSTGNWNVLIGHKTGYSSTTGSSNVIIGDMAGYHNTTGSQNVFLGNSAGTNNTTGGGNVFLGWNSGLLNNEGFNNAFFGLGAGYSNTTAAYNTFLGFSAGFGTQTGQMNTYIGSNAGRSNPAGEGNVVVGESASYATTSGSNNTILGNGAAINLITGASNVIIGSGAAGNETNISNRLFIQNSAADKNNALIYGEFDNKYLTVNGRLGVGKTTPLTRLDVLGGNWNVTGASEGDFRIGDANYRLKIGVATAGGGSGDVRMTAMGGTNRIILGGNGVDVLAISNANVYPWADNAIPLGLSSNRWSVVYSANGVVTTSDSRLKSNIQELNYGLESIMKLEPVSYTWNDGNDQNRKLGLIAQDVDKVITEVVDKGNDPAQTLGINYSELVPVLIKGMQEQQRQINELKELVSKLLDEKLK